MDATASRRSNCMQLPSRSPNLLKGNVIISGWAAELHSPSKNFTSAFLVLAARVEFHHGPFRKHQTRFIKEIPLQRAPAWQAFHTVSRRFRVRADGRQTDGSAAAASSEQRLQGGNGRKPFIGALF